MVSLKSRILGRGNAGENTAKKLESLLFALESGGARPLWASVPFDKDLTLADDGHKVGQESRMRGIIHEVSKLSG
jgi:hypothetical protein